MLHLMSLCRFRVADLPLRPLLYAAGSAATAAAAGVCYFIKRDGEETAEPADTPLTEDPVQTVSSLDPGLMCDDATQTDSAVPEVLTKPPSHHLHFYTSGLGVKQPVMVTSVTLAGASY
ncbi:hypothetical protein QTP86_027160 [Hemibagrus guttatus]|nr:hypothetical protein QTP86_027160 [Hemibagrus guttatus]